MSTELVAVVVAMLGDTPHVLTAPESHATPRLPSGPLQTQHRTMQAGLRSWVEQQTGYHLKYVEQLYTFADPSRTKAGGRIISVSYLGLTRATIGQGDRKSTRLNSSHVANSYAVICLKKQNKIHKNQTAD